jgi:glycerophosphoryl diester phosphodiesterase
LVELDVREAKDHVPMLFHGFGSSSHLYVDCGIDQLLEALTSDDLARITYRLSSQPIARLSDALDLCADLRLGVMLDIKPTTPSNEFLKHIRESLDRNGLASSAVTLGVSRSTEEQLEGKAIFPVSEADYGRLLDGEAVDLQGRYHFDWGSRITEQAARWVQEGGASVIAAINSFHYPRHAKTALAEQDIQRLLEVGVDGFQIDDEFRELVPDKRLYSPLFTGEVSQNLRCDGQRLRVLVHSALAELAGPDDRGGDLWPRGIQPGRTVAASLTARPPGVPGATSPPVCRCPVFRV